MSPELVLESGRRVGRGGGHRFGGIVVGKLKCRKLGCSSK